MEKSLVETSVVFEDDMKPGSRRALAVQGNADARPLFPDPDSPEVRSALHEAGADVVEACRAELARPCDKDRKGRLLLEIAAAQESLLEDYGAAVNSYLSCLDLHPEDLTAIRGARRLFLQLKRVEDALGLFDKELRLIGDTKRKVALYRQKGRLLEDRLGRLPDAKQCYVLAANLDPADFASLEALAQLVRKKQNWKELADLYERQANAVRRDDKLRAGLIAARARLFDVRIDDERLATELYKSALELDPDAGGALGPLGRLLYGQKRWKELAGMLEWEVESCEDPRFRASSLLIIAQIYSERLGDGHKAKESLEQAAKLDPDNRLVLERLARYYAQHDEVSQLAAVLIKILDTVGSDHERVVLSHSIGELMERRIGDEDSALGWYLEALKKSPAYAPAVHALEKIYIRLERWDDLIAMTLAKAEVITDSRKRAQDHALVAEILEKRLKKPQEAIPHYAVALGYDADHENSFKSLIRLYRIAGRHKEAIDLYERAAQRADDELAVAYVFEIGKLYEDALSDPGRAAGAYKRILHKRSDALRALHAYQRTCEAAGSYRELVAAFEKEIELAKDPVRITALIERVAEIYEDHLGDRETALYRYRKVLELDPYYPAAVDRLERIYEELERHKELLDMYERQLTFTGERSHRVELLYRMAKISEDFLGDDSRAADYYRAALTEDWNHPGIFEALTSLLTRWKQWDELATLFEKRCDHLEGKDPLGLARMSFQLGQVHENQRSALSDAARAYERALEAEPGFRPALDGLIRVHAAQRNWGELATQLKMVATLHEDSQSATDALLASGDIYAARLGDKERAVAAYEGALERQPDNFSALLALSFVNRDLESWERLAVVYRGLADATSDEGAKTTALAELARLLADGLGIEDDVKEVWKQVAMTNSSDYAALFALEQLAIQMSDIALRIEVDRRNAAIEEDHHIKASVLVRLGQFLELNRSDEALMVYRECLSLDPLCFGAMRGLERVARTLGDPKALVEALEYEARWTNNGQQAASRLVESAELRCNRLSDPAGGIEVLEEALRRCPDDEGAAESLIEKLSRASEIDRLEEALATASRGAKKIERKSALLLECARIEAEERNNTPAAVATLENLLRDHRDHLPAMIALASLYYRNRQWSESVGILERVIKARCEPEVLFNARFELARILARHLDEPRQALKHARELVRLEPEHRPALVLLAEIKLMLDDLEGAREIEGRLLASADEAEQRAQTYLELSRIEACVGVASRAISMLKEAVALSGPFGEAGETLRSSVGQETTWSTYADALGAYLRNAAGGYVDRSQQLGAVIELSRVQHERLGATQEAVETLQAGVEQWGAEPQLRVELSARLLDMNRVSEAVATLQEAVETMPLAAPVYRALHRALRRTGGEKAAAFALEPLVVLGAADSEEIKLASSRRDRPGLARTGALDLHTLTLLGALPQEWEKLADLLAALGPALTRLQPSKFDEFGIGRKDRIGDEPTRLGMLAERVMQSFAIEDVDLYTVGSAARDPSIALDSPPAVLVPESLAPLPETRQVYMLAPLFAQLTLGLQAAVVLGEQETRRLVAAVLYKVADQPKAPGYPHDDLDTLAKQVLKATPRRSRKQLEDAAQGYLAASNLDVEQCVREARTIARRAGALLAGDLPACVATIEALRGDDPMASSSAQEEITDLLGFWTSVAAFEVRRVCGLI